MTSSGLSKIAVLDDYQGLSVPRFDVLRAAGYEVTTFRDTLPPYSHPQTSQTDKDALASRLEPFSIICSMRERTPFPKALVERLPNLKLLLTTGARNAAIDVEACHAHGVTVAGTVLDRQNPDSTTQHCVTLILALARNIAQDDAVMKTGGWQTSFATSLAGKTFGTVGLGRLGANVAKIMHSAFGMKVIAWSSNLTQEAADEKAKAAGLQTENATGEKTFKAVSKDELFSTADVVSIHVVLSDRSRGLVGADELGKMKKTAFLVNTSRGPIVDEPSLLSAVRNGAIGGVAIDVYEVEPLPQSSEWRTTEWGKQGTSRVLLTPHMGYVEVEALENMYEKQVANVLRWGKGEGLETVYKDNGY